MSKLAKVVNGITVGIGIASILSAILRPIVEKSKNTKDDKILNGFDTAIQTTGSVLNALALNPQQEQK